MSVNARYGKRPSDEEAIEVPVVMFSARPA